MNQSVSKQSSDCFLLCAGYSFGLLLSLKMEATCSSETSVAFHRTTRRCISENRPIQVSNYKNVELIPGRLGFK
jgi:hypothetical protein